ncbi:hypothetical protein [Silvanigrella aquatica]|uniref:Uncharacterized protein n=1 Tax=Silvanigrella aquatica TaxID=1915309 RepID=A0A1L4D1J3_9BACT|nr:hypothetical protein [Silvanigrella aquatica]APJ04060.1 hypothetical protein AXG55_09135 [Silvanigrella aquatica]
MQELKILACIFLFIFITIASIDGIYFHLYKYKLFAIKESKKEHLLHTANSFLFPFTVLFLFLDTFQGLYLWIGIFLTLLTLVIEFLDVFEENKSRKNLGGLTSLEYSMHFAMSGLRATFTTLILVSKPQQHWSIFKNGLASEIQLSEFDYTKFMVYPIFVIGIIVFLIHFSLIFYKNDSIKEIKMI